MKTRIAVIERCPNTGTYIDYVPRFSCTHSQAGTLDELNGNLREVIEMLRIYFCAHLHTGCEIEALPRLAASRHISSGA